MQVTMIVNLKAINFVVKVITLPLEYVQKKLESPATLCWARNRNTVNAGAVDGERGSCQGLRQDRRLGLQRGSQESGVAVVHLEL